MLLLIINKHLKVFLFGVSERAFVLGQYAFPRVLKDYPILVDKIYRTIENTEAGEHYSDQIKLGILFNLVAYTDLKEKVVFAHKSHCPGC